MRGKGKNKSGTLYPVKKVTWKNGCYVCPHICNRVHACVCKANDAHTHTHTHTYTQF